MTGSILVVTGPPAAGKTTLARLLAARRSPSTHLHADDFWQFVVTGYVDPWLPESQPQNEVVIRAVCATAATFAAGGYEVVLDGVVGPWFMHELVAHAAPYQARIDYVVLLPALEVTLANLAARTGHGFTSPDAAAKMHREFTASTADIADHVVDTSGLTPDEALAVVEAALAEGTLGWPHT